MKYGGYFVALAFVVYVCMRLSLTENLLVWGVCVLWLLALLVVGALFGLVLSAVKGGRS
jgi:hypothetical protein